MSRTHVCAHGKPGAVPVQNNVLKEHVRVGAGGWVFRCKRACKRDRPHGKVRRFTAQCHRGHAEEGVGTGEVNELRSCWSTLF